MTKGGRGGELPGLTREAHYESCGHSVSPCRSFTVKVAVLRNSPSSDARRLRPWQADLFAVAITAATFGLRYALSGQLAGQPTLVIFTVPIMVSAYLGGLRAGLISTVVAYLGASYFLLPPLHSFAIASGAERWQQLFIVLAGVVISALNEALHRARRRREKQEREIKRMSRLYAALSQVNQAIVWTPERDALFRKVCEVLVEFGGFHMAWIGWHDAARQVIMPIASCGEGGDSLAALEIFTDGRPGYDGPVATAFREGRPCISNDVQADPDAAAWHALFKQLGVFALAVFPIRENGEVVGTIVIRSGTRGFFQEKEVALLTEAAGDVSFGLDNFAREAERQRLVAELQTSEDRLRAYVEQAADCMFVHDASGQFLDVNPQACASLGYTREELLADESLRGRDQLRPASRPGSLEPDPARAAAAPFKAASGARMARPSRWKPAWAVSTSMASAATSRWRATSRNATSRRQRPRARWSA